MSNHNKTATVQGHIWPFNYNESHAPSILILQISTWTFQIPRVASVTDLFLFGQAFLLCIQISQYHTEIFRCISFMSISGSMLSLIDQFSLLCSKQYRSWRPGFLLSNLSVSCRDLQIYLSISHVLLINLCYLIRRFSLLCSKQVIMTRLSSFESLYILQRSSNLSLPFTCLLINLWLSLSFIGFLFLCSAPNSQRLKKRHAESFEVWVFFFFFFNSLICYSH